jgi:hypothetical protein
MGNEHSLVLRWWFKITWKNIVHKHDLNMVLKSKVSISIMFCVMFWTFLNLNISAILKNIFFTCFYHVFYILLLVFPISFPPECKFCIMSLWHLCYYFLFKLCITSFYNFFFYVSNILIFCYPSSFMKHDLYCFDKNFTMLLPCFRGFETRLLIFFSYSKGMF